MAAASARETLSSGRNSPFAPLTIPSWAAVSIYTLCVSEKLPETTGGSPPSSGSPFAAPAASLPGSASSVAGEISSASLSVTASSAAGRVSSAGLSVASGFSARGASASSLPAVGSSVSGDACSAASLSAAGSSDSGGVCTGSAGAASPGSAGSVPFSSAPFSVSDESSAGTSGICSSWMPSCPARSASVVCCSPMTRSTVRRAICARVIGMV